MSRLVYMWNAYFFCYHFSTGLRSTDGNVRCGSLTNALELGLEFCFLVAIANVEEKIRVTALRELRGWNSSANAQYSRGSFSWLLTPDHPLVVTVIPTTHCDCCTLCHIKVVADLPTWCHGKNINFALDK